MKELIRHYSDTFVRNAFDDELKTKLTLFVFNPSAKYCAPLSPILLL